VIPAEATALLDREPTVDGDRRALVTCAIPHWTRSFDLHVRLPERPPQPAVTLQLPVPGEGQRLEPDLRVEAGGVAVQVRRIEAVKTWHERRGMEVDLETTGADLSDPAGIWIGDEGARTRRWSSHHGGSPQGQQATITMELLDERETLVVEIPSREQVRDAWQVFHFKRVPNLRAGDGVGTAPETDFSMERRMY
jgi:hypothetical protein